jgi:hypothetical protein
MNLSLSFAGVSHVDILLRLLALSLVVRDLSEFTVTVSPSR